MGYICQHAAWLAACILLLAMCDWTEAGTDTSFAGIVDFALDGSLQLGFYTTTVKLGFPPREFKLLIDTRSDISWVACASGMFANYSSAFDPRGSTTAIPMGCTGHKCSLGDDTYCSPDGACSFNFTYPDSGFSSRCATATDYSMNKLFSSDVHGILGLGRSDISVLSQLAYDRVAPRAFYHCLSRSGGGVMALGVPDDPEIVYTPMLPSELPYSVQLREILVNEHLVPIHPSVFRAARHRGTVFDSGSAAAYLTEKAYDAFVRAVTAAVLQPARPFVQQGQQCYAILSSAGIQAFPEIRLEFQGGASLLLAPEDYATPSSSLDGSTHWCLGIHKSTTPGLTILGDLVLRNKLVVYDQTTKRIGWAAYNCSAQVNVFLNYTVSASSVKSPQSWSLPLWCILLAALWY